MDSRIFVIAWLFLGLMFFFSFKMQPKTANGILSLTISFILSIIIVLNRVHSPPPPESNLPRYIAYSGLVISTGDNVKNE